MRSIFENVAVKLFIQYLQLGLYMHKGSLLRMTLTDLQTKHPKKEYKIKSYIERLKTYLVSARSWRFYVLFSILFCFGIPLINIPLINVIRSNSSFFEYLTKYRITHAIALLSILFTIVGIALSNLARKNSYMYRTLIKRSYVYPVLYILVSYIACMAFLYIFDSMISQIIDIERISITCNYLFIISLVVTAICFTQILKFVDEDRLYDYLSEDALRSLIKRNKDFQIASCSFGIYTDIIDNIGIKNYNLMFKAKRDYAGLPFASVVSQSQSSKNYERYWIQDIYIDRLKWLLKKLYERYPEQILYSAVSLNKELYNTSTLYMKSDIPHAKRYLKLIAKCFKVIGVSKSLKRQDCWEFLTQELLEKTRDGDLNRISQILDIQLMIYRNYFEVVKQNV